LSSKYLAGASQTDVLQIQDGEGLCYLNAIVFAAGNLKRSASWEYLLEEGLIAESVVCEHAFGIGMLP